MNYFRSIFISLLIILVSAFVVYFLYRDDLSVANRPIKVITPETYNDSIRDSIEYDDVVEITGTPNLLFQISQETESEDGERSIDYYYTGLKEYGYDFVVKIIPGKLNSTTQTFKGRVTGLSQTEFGSRVKNSLNKEISFEDSVNQDAANEIDEESQEQLSLKSAANFTSATFLVLDEETPDTGKIYFNLAVWTFVISLFIITLFRKPIFGLK